MNLLGKNLDDRATVYQSLREIKGISKKTIKDICMSCGIGLECQVKELTSEKGGLLTAILVTGIIENPDYSLHHKREKEINKGIKAQLLDIGGLSNREKVIKEYKSPTALKSFLIEGGLAKITRLNIEKQIKMRSFKGMRHLGSPNKTAAKNTLQLKVKK